MRLLVTGSSGQIGSFAVDAARAAGLEVVGIDRRPSRWTDVVGDVCDRDAMRLASEGAEAIVHCAAHVSVQGSVDDPVQDARDNVFGTLSVLEAARRGGLRVVNLSSAAVYGVPERVPLDEDHPRRPISPYGVSKLAAETYVALYGDLHGLSVTTVRPFNVYSSRQDVGSPYAGVMSRFASRVAAGERLTIYGDGTQTRDFVHARDVAACVVGLAQETGRRTTAAMNLGSSVEVSVLELAKAFCRAAGSPERIDLAPARAGEIVRSCADASLARKHGFTPSVSLEDGVAEMVKAARARVR